MNVFEYIFICGLPKYEIELLEQRESESKKAFLKPALLEHYPENRVENPWNISVDEEKTLCQWCHPCGLAISSVCDLTESCSYSFLRVRQDGFRSYGHVLSYFDEVSDSVRDRIQTLAGSRHVGIKSERLFVQKSICLITRKAYINISKAILRDLHKIFLKDDKSRKFPVESYLFNLLFELPHPSPGKSFALSWHHENTVVIQQPSNMELPFVDIHLSFIFSLLGGASNVLRLCTSALLEHQILLISKDCDQLMLVAESICTLMFPFQWPHTYVPVLPYKLAHLFLDAPVPFIMGIHMTSENHRSHLSKFDQCFFDIDRNVVECPEDQPSFPNQTTLVPQLNKIFAKFKKRKYVIPEVSEAMEVHGGDDFITPSPPLHRRNAQRGNSKSLGTIRENTTVVQESSDEKLIESITEVERENTVMEDLRNLHAAGGAPEKYSESKPPIPEFENLKIDENELREQIFNIEVREIILGSLLSLFCQYDKFVIHPESTEHDIADTWFLKRETQQNFDKASFLSDQPESHLRFLSAFLETQTFASLIDSRIVSQLGGTNVDPNLKLFDDRIKQAKNMPRPDSSGGSTAGHEESTGLDMLSRSFSIISAGNSAKLSVNTWIKKSEAALKRRFKHVNGRYHRLRTLHSGDLQYSKDIPSDNSVTTFPNITFPMLLQNGENFSEQKVFHCSSIDDNWHESVEPKTELVRQKSMFSPEVIAQTNFQFLGKLLKDVKIKTNKLVLLKMGQEAIELGHTDTGIIEENTLIGSLCDLLERIWCHGLHARYKKGKSALWSHLLMYEQDEKRIIHINKQEIISTLVDGSAQVSLGHHTKSMPSLQKQQLQVSPTLERRQQGDGNLYHRLSQPFLSNEGRCISPLPTDILSNIKRIQHLREVQTDVGKCRAWIRISLEQKQLQVHLQKLLSNRPLLQTMYKRYSLLRCDDERDQLLSHLLSLKTVDFSCFTNSFTKTITTYRIWIFPKKQLSGISQTSANVYVMISGELACTSTISVPKGCLEFSFQHQNLGVVTTLIIGHDNAGLLPKWSIDFIIIRNEITGQAFYLPCGRWLGRSVDDGSTQRLLFAEIIPLSTDLNKFIYDSDLGNGGASIIFSPKRTNSIHDLQERAGQAVNAILKHFNSQKDEKVCLGTLTHLLCKTNGLIPTLSQVFQHGLKPAGFFRKQIFSWDVLTAVCQVLSKGDQLLPNIRTRSKSASPQRAHQENMDSFRQSGSSDVRSSRRDDEGLFRQMTSTADYKSLQLLLELHTLISSAHERSGLGKDDMFQLLMCVALRDRYICDWMRCISVVAKDSIQLYDKSAFMCDLRAIEYLVNSIQHLKDYEITLEAILLRGMDFSLLNRGKNT